eukprot:scaffold3095_cov163-Ochromonas_danica.AAC.3
MGKYTSVPKLAELFRSNGQVTEKGLDSINIVSADKVTKATDEQSLHQQQAVLLNKEDTAARFKLHKTKKVLEAAAKAAVEQQRETARQTRQAPNRQKQVYQQWHKGLIKAEQKAKLGSSKAAQRTSNLSSEQALLLSDKNELIFASQCTFKRKIDTAGIISTKCDT